MGQDYSLVYVADHASRDTTWPYRLAGLWGGMSGSLLLWTWMLAGWALLASRTLRRRLPELAGGAQAVLAVEAAVFLGLLVTVARPFATLAVPAIDGGGLTPILRHPAMLYHPPLLYSGYVGLAVPTAVAVAALLTRAAGDWLAVARRYMLASLVLLAVGLVAGAHWAYVELGWGGYWAWDPVENGALLPWLAGVAFLHSALVARPPEADAPTSPITGQRRHRPVGRPSAGREHVAWRPIRAKEPPAGLADGANPSAAQVRLATNSRRAAACPPASPTVWTTVRGARGVAWRPIRAKDLTVTVDQSGRGRVASGYASSTHGLAFLAFGLSLLGAFLTRSGTTASVHAFAEARAVGRVLLSALVVTAVALVALMVVAAARNAQPRSGR